MTFTHYIDFDSAYLKNCDLSNSSGSHSPLDFPDEQGAHHRSRSLTLTHTPFSLPLILAHSLPHSLTRSLSHPSLRWLVCVSVAGARSVVSAVLLLVQLPQNVPPLQFPTSPSSYYLRYACFASLGTRLAQARGCGGASKGSGERQSPFFRSRVVFCTRRGRRRNLLASSPLCFEQSSL